LTLRALPLLAVLLLWAAGCAKQPTTPSVHVLAAASLSSLLQDVSAHFTDPRLVCQFAASSEVRRQVEQGAAADLIILADVRAMDSLEQAGQVRPGSRQDLFGNILVLVTPPDQSSKVNKLEDLPYAERIAIGEPETVPLGAYTKQSLLALDLWDALRGRLIYGKDARVVASWVRRGEVDAGIVYGSDAAHLRRVARIPSSTHAPIVYPAAIARHATNPDGAARLLAFLASSSGRDLTRAHGLAPFQSGPE